MASNNLYLFGGFGFGSSTSSPLVSFENDLWKYDPLSNNWTWINGSNNPFASGVYGTQGVSSPANMPGARYSSAYWKDGSGNAWVFGGTGVASGTVSGEMNDLWKYTASSNEWTWMKGPTSVNQNGSYGTQGVSAPSNIPGARTYNTFWKGATNKIWLFGGEGFDAASTFESHMNDLWLFTTPCNPDSITVAPGKNICSGTSPTLTAVNGGPSTLWYDSPVSTTTISGGTTLSIPSLTTANTQTVYSYYAVANNCTTVPRASVTITVNALPIVTVSATKTITCKNMPPLTLTVSGANSYTWAVSLLNTNTLSVQPQITTTYVVTGTDLNGCTGTSSIKITVVTDCVNGLAKLNSDSFVHSLFPNPSHGTFILRLDTEFKSALFDIVNALGQTVFEQTLNSSETYIKPELPDGVYFYHLTLNGNKSVTGKLIID